MKSPFPPNANNHSPITHRDWRPDEFGLARALLLASVVVTLFLAGLATLTTRFVATPPPVPVIVHLVEPTAAVSPSNQADAVTPDAAATVPPLPVPEAIAPPMPEPSVQPAAPAPDLGPARVPDVMPYLATEVTPPIAAPSRTAALPRPKPIARSAPPRPARLPPSSTSTKATATEEVPHSSVAEHPAASGTPAPTPADIISGLGPYRAALHRQIERNMLNDHEVQRLSVSGTALVEASLAPDGRVLLARIARSSGNHAIDQAALAAVQRGGFAAFSARMPVEPITISVPIGIETE